MKNRFYVLLILAAAAFGQESDSQGGQSFRGMVRLNRAPVSNEVLHVKLPRPVERQLPNGIKLLILESHRAPAISLTISIPSSHLRDPEGLPGVAEATAAMIQLGTTTKSAREISESLADLGATLNFSSGGAGHRAHKSHRSGNPGQTAFHQVAWFHNCPLR